MPSNLDLDRIKSATAKQTPTGYVWLPDHFASEDYYRDEAEQLCIILNAAPALIAEVERLTQELATAKAVGAAEDAIIFVPTGERKWQFQAMEYFLTEEGNIAYFNQPTDWPYTKNNPRPIYKMDRAAELRKGIK